MKIKSSPSMSFPLYVSVRVTSMFVPNESGFILSRCKQPGWPNGYTNDNMLFQITGLPSVK